MDHRLALLLLIPLAVLVIWLLKILRCDTRALITLGMATVALVWGLLYATFNIIEHWEPFVPEMEFGSVEYIMRDVDHGWLWRYVSTDFGWAVGAAYFALCWGVASLWVRRQSLNSASTQAMPFRW
jgi:hypothetical protein